MNMYWLQMQQKKDLLTSDTQKYRRIRSHARKIAKKFNKLENCCICGYNKHVECSHFSPISSFNDDDLISLINNPSNLSGLCPNHHWEFEHNKLSKQDYQILKSFHN